MILAEVVDLAVTQAFWVGVAVGSGGMAIMIFAWLIREERDQ